MSKSKFTDSQIMDGVKRVEAGFGVPDICRELSISKTWVTAVIAGHNFVCIK
jgi:hypothetical protein